MVRVHVENKPVGTLMRSDIEEGAFFYGYDLTCESQNAVSLTMPVISDPYLFNYKHQLHPIFDMNLPEGELGRRLRQQFSKTIPDFDDLTLLEIVGKSQIGRLRFTRSAENIADIPAQSLNDLIKYDGAAGLFDNLMDRYAIHSGISGVQPKVMLRDSDDEDLSRLTHRDATHIVKTWTSDHPCLAANEFFCLLAAQNSGIEVPNFRLSEHGVFLIVERFDLDPRKGRYLGFEDFCVLNGYTSDQKYIGSYEGIAKRIKDFVSPENVSAALVDYFKMLTLTCMVKNGDAHLKNFGVLYRHTEGKIWLAPAYDVVTTTVYMPNDILALTFGGSKNWPKASRLIGFAQQQCDMSKSKAIEQIEMVAEGMQKSISEIKIYMEDSPAFQEIGSRILMEWDKGMVLTASVEIFAKSAPPKENTLNPNTNRGQYTGLVVKIDERFVYQRHGKDIIPHEIIHFSNKPCVGDKIRIVYDGGHAQVTLLPGIDISSS